MPHHSFLPFALVVIMTASCASQPSEQAEVLGELSAVTDGDAPTAYKATLQDKASLICLVVTQYREASGNSESAVGHDCNCDLVIDDYPAFSSREVFASTGKFDDVVSVCQRRMRSKENKIANGSLEPTRLGGVTIRRDGPGVKRGDKLEILTTPKRPWYLPTG